MTLKIEMKKYLSFRILNVFAFKVPHDTNFQIFHFYPGPQWSRSHSINFPNKHHISPENSIFSALFTASCKNRIFVEPSTCLRFSLIAALFLSPSKGVNQNLVGGVVTKLGELITMICVKWMYQNMALLLTTNQTFTPIRVLFILITNPVFE